MPVFRDLAIFVLTTTTMTEPITLPFVRGNRPVGRRDAGGVHVHPSFGLKFINNSMNTGVLKTVTNRI